MSAEKTLLIRAVKHGISELALLSDGRAFDQVARNWVLTLAAKLLRLAPAGEPIRLWLVRSLEHLDVGPLGGELLRAAIAEIQRMDLTWLDTSCLRLANNIERVVQDAMPVELPARKYNLMRALDDKQPHPEDEVIELVYGRSKRDRSGALRKLVHDTNQVLLEYRTAREIRRPAPKTLQLFLVGQLGLLPRGGNSGG